MNRLFILILIILFSKEGFAQINCFGYTKDDKKDKQKLIVPVFRNPGNEIESYEEFGIYKKVAPKKYKINYPDLKGVLDTAYGFIYVGFLNNAPCEGYMPFLICNYKRGKTPAIFWFDRNGNFNFDDDGKPDTMYLYQTSKQFSFSSPIDSNQKYEVSLQRFDLFKDYNYKRIVEEFYKNYQGNKLFAGYDYSFRETRQNMKGFKIKVNNDSFQLSLYDGNFNGIYNEAEKDRIYLAAYDDTVFRTERMQIIAKNPNLIEWDFKVYELKIIDPFGCQISLTPSPSNKSKREIAVGKKLPNIKYKNENKKTIRLKKYKRKALYIYFWNRSLPTFDFDTAYLAKIKREYACHIEILALNYGDNPVVLNNLREYDSVPYQLGLSGLSINQKFGIERIPSSFLTLKKLKLYQVGISPKELYELLKNCELQRALY